MSAAPGQKIELLALAVASGRTVREWCEENHVNERTGYRWASTIEFKSRVHAHRARMQDEAIGRLSRSLTAATEAFEELVRPGTDERVRLRAARAIVDSFLKFNGYEELSERIRKLEESNYVPRPMEPGPPS